MVKDDNFLKKLAALGFSLLETEKSVDANAALSDMVKSEELRLWEGFPVVLANSAERGLFDYGKATGHLAPSHKRYLGSFVMLSLALYKALGVKFFWTDRLYKSLKDPGKEKKFKTFLTLFKNDGELKVDGRRLSSQRLKTVFNNYFVKANSRVSELLFAKEELGLEYALSQLFSPKQKELFLKKLKGEKLTKTEKEYFSRVVKRKVLALANSELHRLSQKIAESG